VGYHTLFFSHTINLYLNRQHGESIEISVACFAVTNRVALGSFVVSVGSVLASQALLIKV
jgi:hypothetical protein